MKKFVSILLVTFSLNVFAQDQFAGTWSSNENTIRFYSEQGPQDYQGCSTELTMEVESISEYQKKLTISNLKTTCSHPTFWDFNQALPKASFIIDTKTQIVKFESEKVGTISDSKMEIKYDIGGQLFFLDGKFNADGSLHFEWSSRSYETVNFDVVNKLQKI